MSKGFALTDQTEKETTAKFKLSAALDDMCEAKKDKGTHILTTEKRRGK